jgi:hypothetical protein
MLPNAEEQMKLSVVIEDAGAQPADRGGAAATADTRIQVNLSFIYSLRGLIGIILLLSVTCALYLSPVHYLSDSGFSLLMDEALIHDWTPNMIHFRVPRGHGGIFINDGYPWNIKMINGRLLYVYPWGSSLLSLPAVALLNAEGFKIAPHRAGYNYDYSREAKMQAIIATGVCAMTTWVIYDAASAYLPLEWSLAIALAAAFGTGIWSSASRSLWPQTWAVLLMTSSVWVLLKGGIRPFLLGSLVAWACLTRPQIIPAGAAITGYAAVRYDRCFLLRYLAGGLCWGIPVCAIMWFFTGGLFSATYSAGMLDFPHAFWLRLSGLLLSPSRGLLVFSPVALVPLYMTVRYWTVLPERSLAILALIVIGMHLVLLSSYNNWWAGGSYGARYMLEIVPWLVLLAILGVNSFLADQSSRRGTRLVTSSMAALALLVSIGTNAPGALLQNAINWRSFDPHHLDVLWDWRDPQFLCWIDSLQE